MRMGNRQTGLVDLHVFVVDDVQVDDARPPLVRRHAPQFDLNFLQHP